ncbi:hypothetical protein [Vibrio sp. 16]|uniref:hypothetical protein n=1 Tax=Vibrio sp. 16 TaxID=391586 RepID=UPI00018F40D1|nr:hypothetical protein [Vibrio sp. 16]EED25396.1 conserved hypothetical protein [Vibrio sp. 16]CAK4076547.1 hypothetical protein PVDT1_30 [Vibrio sp. 16]
MSKFAGLLLTLLVSLPSAAQVQVKGRLQGDQFQWFSAIEVPQHGGSLKPGHGNLAPAISSTKKWKPGSITQAPNTLQLSSTNHSVIIPISVIGIEYQVATQAPNQQGQVTNSCTNDWFDGQMIRLWGKNCQASTVFSMSQNINPFSSVRPLFTLDTEGIKNALANKPSGEYKGLLTYHYNYWWLNRSDVWTSTNDAQNVMFVIDHQAPEVTKVTVSNHDQLQTHYDRLNDTINLSGETHYQVVAEGQLLTNLQITLQGRAHQYQLKGPNSAAIPYSIACPECEITELVGNGQLLQAQTRISGHQEATQIPFTIRVYFDNTDIKKLERGRYSDVFSLLVSPEL